MKAVLLHHFGDSSQLFIGETTKPKLEPNSDKILVRVKATALNRADLLQSSRAGYYPPPPGESEILGLEIAGVVEEVGDKCSKWKVGDRVMSLIGGGGYAQYVLVNSTVAIKIPNNLSFEEAAAIPEAYMTALQATYWLAELKPNESILIHAGASGVGTAAIQLGKLKNCSVYVTTSSEDKIAFCKMLGANEGINYKEGDWSEKLSSLTNKRGVDVIIDCVGGYWQQNLSSLAMEGRIVMLSTMGGKTVEGPFDVSLFLSKRLTVKGSTLRTRTVEYKSKLASEIENLIPYFENGSLRSIVDKVFNFSEIQDAHRYMESNKNKGKIVVKIE